MPLEMKYSRKESNEANSKREHNRDSEPSKQVSPESIAQPVESDPTKESPFVISD
jgi:hypothetical protein